MEILPEYLFEYLCRDETVIRLSYLQNGIAFLLEITTEKTDALLTLMHQGIGTNNRHLVTLPPTNNDIIGIIWTHLNHIIYK